MISFFWPKDNLVLESPWLRCLVFCNKGIFISELLLVKEEFILRIQITFVMYTSISV